MDTRALTHQYWRMIRVNRRYLLRLAGLAVVYFVAARFGLSLARTTAQVTVVWPPSGIALAVLLVFGLRYAPGIFLGAFLANWTTNEPALVALGIAVGNTLEALAAAYLLTRVAGFRRWFVTSREAIAFTAVAVLCAVIAAVIGTACLAAGGLIQWQHYEQVALTWWQGDVLGMLVFGSFLVVYLNRRAFEILRGRWLEAALLTAAVLGVSVLVFTLDASGPFTYPYLLFPLLMWAAARFTQVGVATGSMLVAVAAIWATVNGRGPFVQREFVEAALIHLQVFVSVITATSLTLAMAITERIEAQAALAKQSRRLVRLDEDLKEANNRITRILAGVLDKSSEWSQRSHDHDRDL